MWGFRVWGLGFRVWGLGFRVVRVFWGMFRDAGCFQRAPLKKLSLGFIRFRVQGLGVKGAWVYVL